MDTVGTTSKAKIAQPVMKLPLFGDAGVGKSSLAKRLCENEFPREYDATKGSSFFTKDFSVKDQDVKALIFDLAGQKRFFSLDDLYWEGASCALAIFDLTRRKTFKTLKGWIDTFREKNPDVPILLAGNKKDLDQLRSVSKEEGNTLAEKYGARYVEVSAKTGRGVQRIFEEIVEMGILNKLRAE